MLRVPTKDAKATAYTIGDGDLEMQAGSTEPRQ